MDAVADGERVVIGGILQHIEEAGVHSGDSRHGAAHLQDRGRSTWRRIRDYTRRLGLALQRAGA